MPQLLLVQVGPEEEVHIILVMEIMVVVLVPQDKAITAARK
jgi:hypothetical protein